MGAGKKSGETAARSLGDASKRCGGASKPPLAATQANIRVRNAGQNHSFYGDPQGQGRQFGQEITGNIGTSVASSISTSSQESE